MLGMCFSLPTYPFNDRLDKKDISRRETNKIMPSRLDRKISTKRKDAVPTKGSVLGHNVKVDSLKKINEKVMTSKDEQKKSVTLIDNVGKTRLIKSGRMLFQSDGKKVGIHGHQEQACESSDCPSKYLILCLKAIENALHRDGTYNCKEDKPLLVNTWGLEFWKCYSARKDILETSGSSSDVEKIAWIASTAADVISRREKEGLLFTGPFLLFLVPSKKKSSQGTFTLQAIESSRHTYSKFTLGCFHRPSDQWVIDGMESLSGGFFLDNIESIRRAISWKLHTVVFSNSLINASNPVLQNLLTGSVYRLSLSDSISSQSACIIQSIHVCSSKEEKIMKMDNALYHAYLHKIIQPLKVLYIVGCSISISSYVNIMDFIPSMVSASSIDTEHISSTDLGEYDLIIIPDFVLSIDDYVQILTRMARHTINGELHSCLTKDDAQHARPLVEILEQCGQTVPEALRNLCDVDHPF